MICRWRLASEPGAHGRNGMGVVEADQPRAIGRVQRERVGQTVRAFLGRLDALDLELDPVALFEMMDAAIESQQELKSVFGSAALHIISGHDNMSFHRRCQWTDVPCTGPATRSGKRRIRVR